jgi:hypothetical protein
MSHHFDYPTDETLDISDAYCFAGPGDRHGPRTVFGMNTSPFGAPTWNAAGYYELKIDTNGDYVEDITFRATFPTGSDGTQHVQVEQLTGAAATDRTASGTIITTPNTPVGKVVECGNGIKLFAGLRPRPVPQLHPLPRHDDELPGGRHLPRLRLAGSRPQRFREHRRQVLRA